MSEFVLLGLTALSRAEKSKVRQLVRFKEGIELPCKAHARIEAALWTAVP